MNPNATFIRIQEALLTAQPCTDYPRLNNYRPDHSFNSPFIHSPADQIKPLRVILPQNRLHLTRATP